MPLGIFTSALFTDTTPIGVAPSASIEVRRESDNALATIWSDVNGSVALGNPFLATAQGMFVFYALGIARGYRVTATKDATVRTLRNVATGTAAEFDASDIVGATLANATIATFLTSLGLGTGNTPAFTQVTVSADPVTSSQVVNKGYFDAAHAALDAKNSVRLATAVDDSLSGLAARDGVTPVAADRVLVRAQTLGQNNGIYVAASGAWTRALDMDAWTEVPNAYVQVEEGTLYADTGWQCTNNQGGTLGTTPIVWVQFPNVINSIGKTAIPIPADGLRPRSANGCAALAFSNGAANQPDISFLAFDGAVKEYAGFYMRMPKSWNESTITAAFDWRRASGTGAANVVFGIRAVAVSDGDSGAATFGSDATVTDAASTTVANFNLSAETGACTIGGTPAELDLVFFEVFRDGASASDTLDAVDAWLTGITLFVTLNAVNDA